MIYTYIIVFGCKINKSFNDIKENKFVGLIYHSHNTCLSDYVFLSINYFLNTVEIA